MPVIVLGSINTDLVMRLPRLPQHGETVLGGAFLQTAGGKGANQAVAAARAGRDPVVLLAAVGDDDFGRAARQSLESENINRRFLKTVRGTPSGVAVILVGQQGENCIGVSGGANLELLPEDIDALPDDVFRAASVFLAGLESPLATVCRGLERARAAGLTTLLNPAPALPLEALQHALPLVDVLTPNRQEAELLTGVTIETPEDALTAARQLQDRGSRRVVITLGKAGAIAVDGLRKTLIAAREAAAIDATAAGDCFSGALAVALAEGQELFSAAEWASIAASICVTRLGAQPSLPRRDEIEVVRAATQFS
jgi:ribokinase